VPPVDLAAPPEEPRPGGESAVEAEATDVTSDGDVDAAQPKPKPKRSRRGARGGKKRRKPAASADAETAASDDGLDGDAPVEVGADGDVPEYVPMSEWIDDFETRSRA